jgi:hypothetical protein
VVGGLIEPPGPVERQTPVVMRHREIRLQRHRPRE